MRNASEASCAAGFDFYLRRNGITTHAIVNEWLEEHHLDAISPRMWKHYGTMFNDGVREYCALNRYEYVESVALNP